MFGVYSVLRIAGKVLQVALVCSLVGPLSFAIGQLLPRDRFDYRRFPYRPLGFELSGKLYRRLKVQWWKDRAPDMSKIVRGVFKKKLNMKWDHAYIEELVRETCVAEFVHYMLMLASPVFLFLLDGWEGVAAMAAYAVCNLPFVIIQRYNRPRLVMIMERKAARRTSKG